MNYIKLNLNIKDDIPIIGAYHIIYDNGSEFWVYNNQPHRVDGPAISWNTGEKFWYIYGKLHCEYGPAVIYPNGESYYYINNIRVNKLDVIKNE